MSDVAEPIIRLEGVRKTFKLPYEKRTSLKSVFTNIFRSRGYDIQQALKDVSFEVKRGEFFGIVGRNGSGKSTLLKTLAGIYPPDSGSLTVNGKLTPFIELGVGFNPELTGRENVYLNGALLGFSRYEIEAMYSDIVRFAELEKFMDQKLKNYSSGMQVRLAFSIAIRTKSDILLIDEVLAVGDAAFQQKCYDYFIEIKQTGTTVVFVSHDMDAVRRFCDKAMLIREGQVQFIGKPNEAADLYTSENEESIIRELGPAAKNIKNQLRVSLIGQKQAYNWSDKLRVKLSWPSDLKPQPQNAGIALFHDGRLVYGSNTGSKGLPAKSRSVTEEIQLNLGPGKYTVVAGLFKDDNLEEAYVYEPNGPEFLVRKLPSEQRHWEGVTELENKWFYDEPA